MDEINVVEVIVKKQRQMYPKGTQSNEDGEFAIVSFSVVETVKGEPKIDRSWGTIMVKGVMPTLKTGVEYYLIAQENYDEKYKNYTYEVAHIGQKVDELSIIKQALLEVTSETLTEKIMQLDNVKTIFDKRDIDALLPVDGIGKVLSVKIMEKYHEKVKYGEYLFKLTAFGLTSTTLHSLIEKYGNYETIYNKVTENPYMLIKLVKGMGFTKADNLAKEMGLPENSPMRIKAYIINFLQEKASNGQSFGFTKDIINGLRSQTDEVSYPLTSELLLETFSSMVNKEELWWNENKTCVALAYVRETEEKIAYHLKRLFSAPVTDDLTNWQTVVKAIEKRNGFEYTDEQYDGIQTVLNNNVCLVTGLAGSGKTSVLEPMTSILVDQQYKELLQLALAGKASQRIQEVTGYEAMTIHRGLEFDPMYGGFRYNKDNQLSKDIVILDEASMVDAHLFCLLLEAIPTGAKLVIVGDYGQLQPIGFGQVFFDLIESLKIPMVKLTKIHRQASKSAVITESIKIRENKHIVDFGQDRKETLGELQDLDLDIVVNKDLVIEKVINAFQTRYEIEKDIMEVQVVVATRIRGDLSAYNINNKIKKLINPIAEEDRYISVKLDKKHTYKISKDDKIIVVENNYNAEVWDEDEQTYVKGAIFNGNLGIVKNIYLNSIEVDIVGVGLVKIPSSKYNTIELGYAITCHKAQGSGWNSVIVAIDSSAYLMLCCEWLYTALTRAKKHGSLIGENKAIRQCCLIYKGSEKMTFLPTMLKEQFQVEIEIMEEVI